MPIVKKIPKTDKTLDRLNLAYQKAVEFTAPYYKRYELENKKLIHLRGAQDEIDKQLDRVMKARHDLRNARYLSNRAHFQLQRYKRKKGLPWVI